MESSRSHARWAAPLAILATWLVASAVVRQLILSGGFPLLERLGNPGENDPLEISQAILLGLGCLVCLWAMIRIGPRQADFYWWVAPAFICLFMCWRELELDERYLGAHAFSWNYLFSESHHRTTWTSRLILAVPSLSLSLATAVLCIRHARLLVATLKRRDLRVSVVLFAAGLGFYLLAQIYDRGYGLMKRAISLPGFAGHRDDFWEEALELAGALAIFLSVLDGFRRRPVIKGTLGEARSALSGLPAGQPNLPARQTGRGENSITDAADE